jgi:hypothetical protein
MSTLFALPHDYEIRHPRDGLFEMYCNGTFVYCHKDLHRMLIVYADITRPADFQIIEKVIA